MTIDSAMAPPSREMPFPGVSHGLQTKTGRGTDSFWHFGRNLNPTLSYAETWDCISRHVYAALRDSSIMRGRM